MPLEVSKHERPKTRHQKTQKPENTIFRSKLKKKNSDELAISKLKKTTADMNSSHIQAKAQFSCVKALSSDLQKNLIFAVFCG